MIKRQTEECSKGRHLECPAEEDSTIPCDCYCHDDHETATLEVDAA